MRGGQAGGERKYGRGQQNFPFLTCFSETLIGCLKTTHVTDSSRGGVVSDPG